MSRKTITATLIILMMLTATAYAAVTLKYFRIASIDSNAVRLEWETATELDHVLFVLSRSDAENGDYQTLETFPAEGDAVSGAHYEYTDTSVIPGMTYWYKLEDIDVNDNLTLAHPPLSAHIPAEGEPTYTPTPTVTETPTATPTQEGAPTATPTATATWTPSATATYTPTYTPVTTQTPGVTPTATWTPRPTYTPTWTPIPTFTPTWTPPPTQTPAPGVTATPAPPTDTPIPGVTATATTGAPPLAPEASPTPPAPVATTAPAATNTPQPITFPTPPGDTPPPSNPNNASTILLIVGLAALLAAGVLAFIAFRLLRQ